MAADRGLAADIASGAGGNYQADAAGAFAQGSKLIKDQIDDNVKTRRADQDREYELEKRKDEEFLRKQNLEKNMVAYNAKKSAYFDQIEQARQKGLIDESSYDQAVANREEFWKDQTKALKLGVDSAGLGRRLQGVLKGEGNWGKALEFSQTATISDSSPEAQRIDLAIEGYAQKNGATPPPVVSIDGKDYFEIPAPDGGEPVRIPVEQMGNLSQQSDLFGQFKEPVSVDGFQADFMAQHPKLDNRFRNGQGSQTDLNEISRWFDSKIEDPAQIRELADSIFLSTDFDASKYNVTDIDGDGKITGADLDVNKDGEVDANEAAIVKEIFTDVIKNYYPENQGFNQEAGALTPQEQVVNQTLDYIQKGGNVNSLVRLPGVFDVSIKDGVAYAHLGKDRTEKNAFAIPLNSDGTVSADGLAKLQLKLGYKQQPKVDVPGSDPKPGNTEVVKTVDGVGYNSDGVAVTGNDAEEDVPKATDVDSGDRDNPPTDQAADNRHPNLVQYEKQGAIIQGGKLVDRGTLSSTQIRTINEALEMKPDEITAIQELVKSRRVAVGPDGEISKTGSASSREMRKIERLVRRIQLFPEEGISIFPKGYKRTTS